MAEENGGAFPLVDRPTPLADRVRNRVSQNNLGSAMGKRLGEFLNSDDEIAKAKVADELGADFKQSLADEIEVPVEHISDDVVGRMASMFTEPDADEVLTSEAKVQLGLEQEPEEEEDETSFSDE